VVGRQVHTEQNKGNDDASNTEVHVSSPPSEFARGGVWVGRIIPLISLM
jgi:hypothetical protein